MNGEMKTYIHHTIRTILVNGCGGTGSLSRSRLAGGSSMGIHLDLDGQSWLS